MKNNLNGGFIGINKYNTKVGIVTPQKEIAYAAARPYYNYSGVSLYTDSVTTATDGRIQAFEIIGLGNFLNPFETPVTMAWRGKIASWSSGDCIFQIAHYPGSEAPTNASAEYFRTSLSLGTSTEQWQASVPSTYGAGTSSRFYTSINSGFHHYVGVFFDTDSTTPSGYYDGVSGIYAAAGATYSYGGGAGTAYLHCRYPGSYALDGYFNEAAVWNCALSSDEISTIYNNGNTISGGIFNLNRNSGNYRSADNLIGWWRADQAYWHDDIGGGGLGVWMIPNLAWNYQGLCNMRGFGMTISGLEGIAP